MNNHENSSLFAKAYNPILQAAIVLGLVLFTTLLGKFTNSIGFIEVSATFPWLVAASFMLFYAVFNSVFSLSAADLNKYWTKSMLCFAGVAAISGLMAYFFSAIPISEARSYPWIFIVVTFGYLVFLSVMGFMKRIVEFAENEEWQKPRRSSNLKKRKR